MSRFYLYLWFIWVLRLTFWSVLAALVLAMAICAYIYVSQGMQALTPEVRKALYDITKFWFVIMWNLTLLLFLFRSLRDIFNNCYNNYKLQLLTCPNEGEVEVIKEIGYGDLVKVWRKWFMLIIWLVGAQMIIVLILTYVFSSYTSVFDWFNIYILYAFILLAGYFSFMILSRRCKRVRLVKCSFS